MEKLKTLSLDDLIQGKCLYKAFDRIYSYIPLNSDVRIKIIRISRMFDNHSLRLYFQENIYFQLRFYIWNNRDPPKNFKRRHQNQIRLMMTIHMIQVNITTIKLHIWMFSQHLFPMLKSKHQKQLISSGIYCKMSIQKIIDAQPGIREKWWITKSLKLKTSIV